MNEKISPVPLVLDCFHKKNSSRNDFVKFGDFCYFYSNQRNFVHPATMKTWLKISLLLCLYGFFREMRPSEPFVFEFLTGEWRNITEQQVIEVVLPMGTYFNFGLLVIVFLVTDMLRYKSVIVVSALSGVGLFATLLWTTSFEALIATQFFYGLFMATEVAYYTYIYAKVERKRYQQVTSNSRSAILVGRFVGSVLAQVLINFEWMDVRELNYISFGNQIISLFVGVLLPSIGTSLYFYSTAISANKPVQTVECSVVSIDKTLTNGYMNKEITQNEESAKSKPILSPKTTENVEELSNHSTLSRRRKVSESRSSSVEQMANGQGSTEESPEEIKGKFSCRNAYKLLWEHFKLGYSNKTVLIWSTWWALAMSGFLMIWSYVQPLWHFIDPDRDNLWNGAAEALVTLFGALSAMAAALFNQNTIEKWDIWILTVCSAVQGGFLLIAAFATNVFVAYAMYIAFGTLYHFMITVTSATIAKFLVEDSFALIFGINTLFALFFQVILTIVVVSGNVFTFNPRETFYVFGGFFVVLACIFGVFGIGQIVLRRWRKNKTSFDIQ